MEKMMPLLQHRDASGMVVDTMGQSFPHNQRHGHDDNVPSDEEAQDAREASRMPNTGASFLGGTSSMAVNHHHNGTLNNTRRRSRTWSSSPRYEASTMHVGQDIAQMAYPPFSDNSEEESVSSLDETTTSEDSIMEVNVPSQHPRRRRRRHGGPSSRSRRMQSLRIGLVVIVYLGLVSQPTPSFRTPNSSLHDNNLALFSPQHGREMAFPPTNKAKEMNQGTLLIQEKSRDLTDATTRVNKKRLRRPVVAHAHVSNQAAPVFVLKKKKPIHSSFSTQYSPLAILPWFVLLWLVLETGCREAQSRFQQVMQRRRRDVWQQRRLYE